MSENYVERQALLCGFSVEKPQSDYGVDLLIFTYTNHGEPEAGEVRVQVKATDRLKIVRNGEFIAVRIDRVDIRSWILEPMPVILVMYDAEHERAYWLYVQAHFEGTRRFLTSGRSDTLTIRIPVAQMLDAKAIRAFQGFRDAVVERIRGLRHA